MTGLLYCADRGAKIYHHRGRALILDTLKTVIVYAITNEAESIEKIRQASEMRRPRPRRA